MQAGSRRGHPSPSLRLPGNSSLGLGLGPSPAPPRLRLRSVWNRILPPHPRPETASCRSCPLEPPVSLSTFLPVERDKGSECVQVCAGVWHECTRCVCRGRRWRALRLTRWRTGRARSSLGVCAERSGLLSQGLCDNRGAGGALPGPSGKAVVSSFAQTRHAAQVPRPQQGRAEQGRSGAGVRLLDISPPTVTVAPSPEPAPPLQIRESQ